MTNEELVHLIKQGQNELMADLYEQNKPVIRMIAQRLQHDANDFEDALQDAYLGLVAAVNAYDESKEYKFITYASYHIKQAINRGKHTIQPIPEWLRYRVYKIKNIQEQLTNELNRIPTTAEIADKMNLSIKDIQFAIKAVLPPKPIDIPLSEDFTLADTISDDSIDFENSIADIDQQQQLHVIVNKLTDRERKCIRLYYFQKFSYDEIGEQLCISKERVRQIIEKALFRLRQPDVIKQLIDEEIDFNTLFYQHRGVKTFNNTWTSATEQVVIMRERKRKDLEKQQRQMQLRQEEFKKSLETMSYDEKVDALDAEIEKALARIAENKKKYQMG